MSTPARFVLSYVAVFVTMVTWWFAMNQAATVGPIPLLVVAYVVPVAAWWAVVALARSSQAVQRER